MKKIFLALIFIAAPIYTMDYLTCFCKKMERPCKEALFLFPVYAAAAYDKNEPPDALERSAIFILEKTLQAAKILKNGIGYSAHVLGEALELDYVSDDEDDNDSTPTKKFIRKTR